MPFTLLRIRKRPTTSNGSSVAAGANNSTTVDTENNTASQKRKKLSTKPTHAINSKAVCEYGGDISNYRRWDTYPHDEPSCISSILWQLSEEGKIIKLADYVGIEHEPFHQDECDVGHGRQGNYMDACSTAYNALEEHYIRLGDDRGLKELQEDVAYFRVSIDSDTNTYEEVTSAATSDNSTVEDVGEFSFDNDGNESIGDELGELRTGIPADGTPLKFDRAPTGVESGEQSADVVAVVDGNTALDSGNISVDIGSNESINGATDGLGESSTSTPADVPLHDNAQSSTTTTTLKLDISCIRHGVEENRKDDGPSPTNATANLSSFTNTSPAPESNNGSYDEGEHNITHFSHGGNDALVSSSKKGKTSYLF